jgi:hypothetical protein
MKKPDKNRELLERLMKESGNVKCEKCSVPNWDIWHTPGNPCPKNGTFAASGLQEGK